MGAFEDMQEKLNVLTEQVGVMMEILNKVVEDKSFTPKIIYAERICEITGINIHTFRKTWKKLQEQGYPIFKQGQKICAVESELKGFVMRQRQIA